MSLFIILFLCVSFCRSVCVSLFLCLFVILFMILSLSLYLWISLSPLLPLSPLFLFPSTPLSQSIFQSISIFLSVGVCMRVSAWTCWDEMSSIINIQNNFLSCWTDGLVNHGEHVFITWQRLAYWFNAKPIYFCSYGELNTGTSDGVVWTWNTELSAQSHCKWLKYRICCGLIKIQSIKQGISECLRRPGNDSKQPRNT